MVVGPVFGAGLGAPVACCSFKAETGARQMYYPGIAGRLVYPGIAGRLVQPSTSVFSAL